MSNLHMDHYTGGLLHMSGPQFTHLESLTLAATADIEPTRSTLPFCSCWVSIQSHSCIIALALGNGAHAVLWILEQL